MEDHRPPPPEAATEQFTEEIPPSFGERGGDRRGGKLATIFFTLTHKSLAHLERKTRLKLATLSLEG